MKISIKQVTESSARTLPSASVGTHESGWTISGEVQEDYYLWVNYFEATHPIYGWVKGDYEDVIHAKSKKAYEHFIKNHPPENWDYGDI